MKKLCVAVVLFAVGIVFVAVWFSPLVWIGEPTAYYDIGASQTDREETDGMIVVYAFSPRVCAATQSLANGAKYNVMACLRDGHISVGTPVLSGCY